MDSHLCLKETASLLRWEPVSYCHQISYRTLQYLGCSKVSGFLGAKSPNLHLNAPGYRWKLQVPGGSARTGKHCPCRHCEPKITRDMSKLVNSISRIRCQWTLCSFRDLRLSYKQNPVWNVRLWRTFLELPEMIGVANTCGTLPVEPCKSPPPIFQVLEIPSTGTV